MGPAQERRTASDLAQTQAAPPLPATSIEFINALAHYYRAELGRMAGWRDRLDRTSNWAITVVAAMLSVSLSTPTSHHGVLLFAMMLILLLLWIEARRYRFFDVYRARVRKMERNYFARVFSPCEHLDWEWAAQLAQDLREPRLLMSQWAAVSRRLRRNYIWMFLVLLLAWLLKISTPTLQHEGAQADLMHSAAEIVANAALGPIPGWAAIVVVTMFYGWLALMAFWPSEDLGELAYGEVHV